MKKLYMLAFAIVLAVVLPVHILCAQSVSGKKAPKVIIGITVDQMRYDYLYRYTDHYGENGIKRLLREGFSCENNHFNYTPTYTGPGHASIYTGSTPAINGIVANDWYDREWQSKRYVTASPKHKTVGAPLGKSGQHSPAVLLSSTITDELRLSNNMRSKVLGVCLKDRGGILPAGHIPNGCYWFDDGSGNWITSTYYPDSLGLPKWASDFNNKKVADKYLSREWDLMRPVSDYHVSFAGCGHFEIGLKGNKLGCFPYPLKTMKDSMGIGLIRYTPFGNSMTLDFALAAMEGNDFGKDQYSDFLCLSFSSTDYVGHMFGIHAQETEDTYLRLDTTLARLFDYVDKQFGKENVLIFLTADHGSTDTPAYLQSLGIPAGIFQEDKIAPSLEKLLNESFKTTKNGWIQEVINQQIYLAQDSIAAWGLSSASVSDVCIKYLRTLPGVYDVHTKEKVLALPDDYPYIANIRRGIHPRRSGDIIVLLDPAWHPDEVFTEGGTTHGSPYPYDTHVPLIWWGGNIPRGETFRRTGIVDISPTLAALLRIMEPNGCIGTAIEEVLKK